MHTLFIASCFILGASASFTTGEVETVATGFRFTEGPVWLSSGELLFSDIPADRIYRMDKSVFREPSGQSNGLTLNRQGQLIAAEHKNRRIARMEKSGAVTVLASRFEGKRLNSPNDVIIRSDGMLFFTDPPYGLEGGLEGADAELDFSGVYALSPKGKLTLLAKDFTRPNGLALSPDERTLYVADTKNAHIRAFQVNKRGLLSQDRILYKLPNPDGMKVDTKGNIWSTAKDGIHVISPQGKHLETIVFPEQPANCAFGDADGKTLYVTARKSVYKVRVNVEGIRPKRKYTSLR